MPNRSNGRDKNKDIELNVLNITKLRIARDLLSGFHW